jgi:hypothetical protein
MIEVKGRELKYFHFDKIITYFSNVKNLILQKKNVFIWPCSRLEDILGE